MRVAVAADLHVKLSGPRSAECERTMSWLRDDLIAQRPDLIVVAGDFYHQRATPAEERFAQKWLQDVSLGLFAATGRQIPIMLVRGNHDDADQLEVLGQTRAAPGEKPTWAPIHAVTRPTSRGCNGANVSLIPWPNLGALAAAMAAGASIADRREAAHAALVDVLRGFQPIDPSAPHLLIAHANILGASQDAGQPVCGGDELALSVGDLMEARPDVILAGHIHAAQQMTAPVPCHYVGSLFRGSFGEALGDKGYTIAEWDGAAWTLSRRESPARRMLLVNCAWTDGHLDGDEVDPEECQDAEIRVRVEFPSDEREAARAAAEDVRRTLMDGGAYSVTIDPQPIVVSRTRCAEIAKAKTTGEKLSAWAQATGLEVPPGAATKLAQIEGEVGHA